MHLPYRYTILTPQNTIADIPYTYHTNTIHLIQRRAQRAFEVLHNESCRVSAISSQMGAPGKFIFTGCAEGMCEMAL